MSDQEASKLSQPCVGSLDDPAPLVPPQFTSVLVAPLLVVLPVRHNQFNAALLESLAKRIGIVTTVGYDSLRSLPRPASRPRDADFAECGFRKRSFSRRGTFKPNSQRKTLTVDQYHPLRALATLGFTDCGAPFLAGAKLPSRKLSSHFNKPSPSSTPSSVRQAFSHTPSSSHCFNRRQQVAGDGYWAGRNRHLSTHKMPSRQTLFEAHGRPRLSLRRCGSGRSGSISFHCSSVNSSNRFLLMQEAQQNNVLSESNQFEAESIYETVSSKLFQCERVAKSEEWHTRQRGVAVVRTRFGGRKGSSDCIYASSAEVTDVV